MRRQSLTFVAYAMHGDNPLASHEKAEHACIEAPYVAELKQATSQRFA